MQLTGNTILITGGGSGIGQGLAEAFQALGNTVIIAGRRQKALDATTAANPGMRSVQLDIDNAEAIRAFSTKMAKEYPALNVVIHNAGIMRPENLLEQPEELTDAEAIIRERRRSWWSGCFRFALRRRKESSTSLFRASTTR